METLYIIRTNLSAENIAKLDRLKNAEACKQAAQDPETPIEILEELFRKFPQEVLSNQAIDSLLVQKPSLFENFFWRNTNCFKYAELPLFFQKWAASHSHSFIRSAIAGSHKASMEAIEILAKDNNFDVICSLLTNSKLNNSILERLALSAMKPENYNNNLIFMVGLHPNINSELRNKVYLFCKDKHNSFNNATEVKINSYDDFYKVVKATSIEMIRIGWSKHMGEKYLKRKYRRRSRFQLKNEQLLEFWKYLLSL